MKPKPILAAEATERRRCAESRLRERHTEADPLRNLADTERLLHELQVHQIELEMQNEELQQARDAIELEREKFSDLYDFAPVGYLTLDREGTIHEVNLTGATLLGIERSRLLQRRFGSFVVADDLSKFNDFLQKVFAGKARESCDMSLLTSDISLSTHGTPTKRSAGGTSALDICAPKAGNLPALRLPRSEISGLKAGKPRVEVRLEAVMDASGQACRMVATEITEIKRAEADRLLLSKLESTGILAGGIAHDFNNLLAVVLMNLEMGQMLTPAGEELGQCLEEAKKAALLAADLTHRLITFASGGTPIRRSIILSPLIHESISPAFNGSRVRCEFSLAKNLWPVEADAPQVGQVFWNLALNAREAMPNGGVVSVRAENRVLLAQEEPGLPPDRYVRVSFTDQGSGIAPEVLPKIFDPYFSTKQRGEQKGMGLGLTISHSIIQKHGGAIRVETGAATTFHVFLPAAWKQK